MVHLTKEQLNIFIQENNIQLTVYEFRRSHFIRGPIEFSILGEVLRLKEFSPERTKLDCEFGEFEDALRRLNSDFFAASNLNSLKKVLKESKKEEDLEVGIGIQLISKLAGTVSTNCSKSQIKCPCGCQQNVQANDKMWIGSSQTWYGELDLIAGNPLESANVSNIMVAEEIFRADTDVTETQNDEDFNDSPEEKTNVEVKQKIVDIKQVIPQSVVFAFTEYNRHPSKGAYIPSIVVSRDCFCFVIYNPVMDLLLVSGDIEYSYDNVDELDENNFCRAFIFIWIIVNHRAFFRPDVPFAEKMIISNKSSFHKIMEGPPNELHCYNKLKDYASHISLDSIEKSQPKIGTESLLSMESLLNVRKYDERP